MFTEPSCRWRALASVTAGLPPGPPPPWLELWFPTAAVPPDRRPDRVLTPCWRPLVDAGGDDRIGGIAPRLLGFVLEFDATDGFCDWLVLACWMAGFPVREATCWRGRLMLRGQSDPRSGSDFSCRLERRVSIRLAASAFVTYPGIQLRVPLLLGVSWCNCRVRCRCATAVRCTRRASRAASGGACRGSPPWGFHQPRTLRNELTHEEMRDNGREPLPYAFPAGILWPPYPLPLPHIYDNLVQIRPDAKFRRVCNVASLILNRLIDGCTRKMEVRYLGPEPHSEKAQTHQNCNSGNGSVYVPHQCCGMCFRAIRTQLSNCHRIQLSRNPRLSMSRSYSA